jgi:hypothetical protein
MSMELMRETERGAVGGGGRGGYLFQLHASKTSEHAVATTATEGVRRTCCFFVRILYNHLRFHNRISFR